MSTLAAMRDARRFLRGDFTPDTWTPESKPLLPPTNKAPYGRCGECRKPVEPHGTTCVYCSKPYGPFPILDGKPH